MSRIWSMMDIGRRSMMNSQTGLQTISHNIANKGTEGYSRQRVELQSNVPTGFGKLRIGTGALASKITRTNNPYLERQIEKEGNGLGYQEARSEALARVEQVYNEQTNKGLNKYMGEFFNAFRELSNSPENIATRTLVKETADFLTKDFKRVDRQLAEIQYDIDNQIIAHVESINEMTKEVAQLNEKIQIVELNDVPANDERDRRDHLLKELSKKINVRYAEGDAGQITLMAGNSAILVSGYESRPLEVHKTPAHDEKREGRAEIFYRPTERGTAINVTSELTGGQIGGLLAVREETINGLMARMNEMAYTLAREVNKAHEFGFTRYNQKGVSFFDPSLTLENAAAKLSVNEAILKDVGHIAAGVSPDSPADNRVANVIASIQYKTVTNDGQGTLDDFYNSIVGQVGVETRRANSGVESQKDVVKQLKNIRESISGVSLDEETTKMIEFQKSFDASARMIRTADEMMDTVLNLKR